MVADGVDKPEGNMCWLSMVRAKKPTGVQEQGTCTQGFSRNLGDLGLSHAANRGGHPVTKDQAARRSELHLRVEQTKQFRMGTVVQVH